MTSKQPQPNWFNYRANEEQLKKEEWLHRFRVGPYKDLDDDQSSQLLVERVESVISADISRMIKTNGKKDEEPAATVDAAAAKKKVTKKKVTKKAAAAGKKKVTKKVTPQP